MRWATPLLVPCCFLAVCQTAFSQVIVDDDFNYADQAAFEAVWNPEFGQGDFDLTGLATAGILVPDAGNSDIIAPNDDPPGVQDKAIAMTVLVNDYMGKGNLANPFAIVPTADKAIKFGGDLFDDISGNKKLTLGLRNDTYERDLGVFGLNFFELGFYNEDTFDPTDPANAPPNDPVIDQPATGLGYRIVLIGGVDGDLVRQPNWQYFPLDPSLDIYGDVDNTDPENPIRLPDGLVSSVDIGQGWHRWEATITETDVTLTLDLFRDGVINLTRDSETGDLLEGVGDAGFDSVVTWEITLNEQTLDDEFAYEPFTSLRFGVPSGQGGGVTHGVIDNVLLELVDIPTGTPGDFDGDGDVDGIDFLEWQRGNSPNPLSSGDLADWQSNYGAGAVATLAAVPEPVGLTLMLLGGLVLGLRRSPTKN